MDLASRLENYLKVKMPAAENIIVGGLTRIPGGASRESWFFDATWQEKGEWKSQAFVLRRDPTASLLQSDRTVEFRVMQRLEGTPVPVPKMYWLEQDVQWLERPFFIMERLPGVPCFPTFPAGEFPEVKRSVARQLVEILAHIHRVDWQRSGLAFLGVREKGAEAALDQIALWEETFARGKLEEHPVLCAAFRWLKGHVPQTEWITLVHGDYRAGNFLYHEGRIRAILDWEMTHLGDPLEDLGWAVMKFWEVGGLTQGFLPREEFLAGYQEVSGIAVDRERLFFYEVLGHVKMAVIALSGVRSFCEGKSADALLALVGFLVPRLLHILSEQLGLGPFR